LEYGILWFTALVNILLYVPLFFCLRGNLVVNPYHKDEPSAAPRLKVTWQSVKDAAWATNPAERQSDPSAIAKQMLAYPIAYSKSSKKLLVSILSEPIFPFPSYIDPAYVHREMARTNQTLQISSI
jgi:hypothetical protein